TAVTISTPNGDTVAENATLALEAEVTPNGSNQEVTWAVAAGTGTATIDAETGVLTGQTAGTVTVTATSVGNSNVSDTQVITVVSTL
ncbi:Ig-like domain-containing protein, partial [Saccharibacillus deserti]|uniref:Ig-like domain-containing protein n=1 Tax=Saccharibacillus deserti TaxID=1634444 RepID=UPI001553AB43